MAKKIIIGADHAGFQMKEQVKECLAKLRVPFDDYGTYSDESTDYPLIAQKVARDVAKNKTRGILICGTGIGMCISANKVKGVRAALAYDAYTSKASREHNDANV
ncbi:TPA: RpiB/LacA/LacB family sugar-phosphate isomerase, partial [Candidatus Woesearchaeota archaeon]|nr:RpiB/LacA/LacB family sugar-phosphate isomerase [Candidatus Woesearchaeota archaeon]